MSTNLLINKANYDKRYRKIVRKSNNTEQVKKELIADSNKHISLITRNPKTYLTS